MGGGRRDDRAFIQSTLMGTNKTVSVCAKAAQQVFYYIVVTIAIVATRMRRKSTFTLGYGHNPPATRRPSVSRHHQENIMQISGLCVTHVSSQAAR